MSNKIKAKLNTIEQKLDSIKTAVLDGKRKIAYAIKYNGVQTVNPYNDASEEYDTFDRYAFLIRSLLNPNAMIFEYTIDNSRNTDYHRTVVLPFYCGSGYMQSSLNQLAKDIIAGVTVQPQPKSKTINPQFDLSKQYSYSVDWGDGSDLCVYDPNDTIEENRAAMYHTYAVAGTYDVTISGLFKRIYSNPRYESFIVESGNYVYDTDGTTKIYDNSNYASTNHLVEVVAWGNTGLTSCYYAFSRCKKLRNIPMYDTTNSFENLTTTEGMFINCTSLSKLPWNPNTNKGLFSNCKKITSFALAFSGCTGIKSEIPIKFIDGCENVTSLAGMFSYAGFQGSIPVGMLDGMSKVTNASEMFASCNITGELSEDLFKDCPNITSLYRCFYNCKNVTGTFKKNFIGGLTKLTDLSQAFYYCEKITGFESDAFYNLTSNNINFREAFCGCKGITEIPTGLLESLQSNNLMCEMMFRECTGLTSIAPNAVASLKTANARGMFGGCTGVTSACPNANSDWNNYDTMKKWYGAFAGCNFSDKNSVALELGGDGNRKFSQGNVNKIMLTDKSLVEVKDYVYNASNKPIGVVYADEYLDESKCIPTLGNNLGNIGTTSDSHYVFAMSFNDTTKQWTDTQLHSENITTITETTNVEVAYGKWTYNGSNQTRNATRYNGVAYSKALRKFILEKGYANNVLGSSGCTSYQVLASIPSSATDLSQQVLYFVCNDTNDNKYDAYMLVSGQIEKKAEYDIYLSKIQSTRYPAISYVNSFNTGSDDSGNEYIQSDSADLWDMYTQRYLHKKAFDKIVQSASEYTTSNCLPLRTNTWYWASAEGSAACAWYCSTDYAHCNYSNGKWFSTYVRPSLALRLN